MPYSLESYPPTIGSIAKDYFRFTDHKNASLADLRASELNLWDFVQAQAAIKTPRKEYSGLAFLGAGWEWSAFLSGNNTIIKIPAGIFDEVSTPEYLANTQAAYDLTLKYFPTDNVAETSFTQIDGINTQTQEYIHGKNNFFIGYNTQNKVLLSHLDQFLQSAIVMLNEESWLPDFDVKRAKGGFLLRNVIIEDRTWTPKIIDFNAYYDAYRLYPQRTEEEVVANGGHITNMLEWIQPRLDTPEVA